MYTKAFLPVLLLAAGLFLTACGDNDTASPEQQDISQAEDAGLTDYLIEDVEQLSDDVVELRSSNAACPEITFAEPEGTFPNVITIDFGDACEGPHGHIRSGKIIITQSAHMSEAGGNQGYRV